jgi:hypothetical protein
VLGLAEQVGGAHLGVDRVVGDDQRLGGPGEQVDADPAVELALGLGDEGVAGPHQHVDRRDRAGADRHGGDRLDAAEHVDLVGAGECIAATIAGCAAQGGGAVDARGTPATLAVSTLMCAEAIIGYLPPGT